MAVLVEVESVNRTRIAGWAVNDVAPDEPVGVELLIDGSAVATTTAHLPRSQFADPQRTMRKQGFVLDLPDGLGVDFERMAVRAGAAIRPLGAHLSRTEGVLEQVSPEAVSGWAWRIGYPDRPVALTIMRDGEVIARTVANLFRPDLEAAGVGNGQHGFECALPDGLGDTDVTPDMLQVVADHSGDVLHDLRGRAKVQDGLPPRLELLPTQGGAG